TFSSSIPAAVISMSVLRFFRDSNILENNMVQTQASAAGTLSAIIFSLPGLVMVGYWNGFPFWQTAGICAIGGILGVMYTIPLRRAMVVETDLPYPEGVAAAEILRVGSGGRDSSGKGAAQPGERAEAGVGAIIAGSVIAAAAFRFSPSRSPGCSRLAPRSSASALAFLWRLLEPATWWASSSVSLCSSAS